MDLMSGNPLSIRILASFLKNKALEDQSFNLAELYKMVHEHAQKSDLGSKKSTSSNSDQILKASVVPLKLAADQSLKLIKKNKDVNDLLLLLSCFPHGIRKPYIENLMVNENLDQSIYTLKNLSFLQDLTLYVKGNQKSAKSDTLKLTTFIQEYSQLKLDQPDKQKFMSMISSLFAENLKAAYKTFKVAVLDNNPAKEKKKLNQVAS